MKKKIILTRMYRILLVFLLAGSTLALGSAAIFAATMPGYTALGSVADITSQPTVVALDSQGHLYIAEPVSSRISIFTQSGHYISTLKNVGNVISVAVDATGKIFVGNYTDKSVTAYGPGLNKLFTLGIGAKEFGLPADITTDIAGNVYVSDKSNNAVKIYNGDNGTLVATLSALGGTALLHHPISVAMNEAASELIVLDRQLTPDARSIDPWVDGAAFHVFKIAVSTDPQTGNSTTTWTWNRSFDKFGPSRDTGEIKLPEQVAVDGQSRIYILENLIVPVVMVYANTTGDYLGNIPVAGRDDMTIGSANLMYVAKSSKPDAVQVYGLDSFSASLAAPSPLAYKATQGGIDPQPQSMTIKNLGNTDLVWNAITDETWITLASSTATLAAAKKSAVDVSVVIDGLVPGIYKGKITITSNGTSDYITVGLLVKPNPLVVVPADVDFGTVSIGKTPTTQSLSVADIGGGGLNWQATVTEDQNWSVKLSSTSGQATVKKPSKINVYAEASGVAAGDYTATITFSSNGNPDVDVPVTLTLVESGVVIPVDVPGLPAAGTRGLNIDGRNWRVTQVLEGTTNLHGVWGVNLRNAFIVGDNGTILQKKGRKWTTMISNVTTTLNSVWGSDKDNVYAVGVAGTMLQYNGTDWSKVGSQKDDLQDVWGEPAQPVGGLTLRSIWGSSATDVFVVGEAGLARHSDGGAFTDMVSGTTEWLNSVWGSSDSDVFAVGENGTIIHYDGSIWSKMDSGTTETLNGVWGNSANDVFAVGANAVVLHYDGTDWTTIMTSSGMRLNDVWASGKAFVIAVGDNGIILTAQKAKFPWGRILCNIAESAKREKEKSNPKK